MKIKELNKSYLNKLVRLNGLAFKSSARELGAYSSKDVREYFEFTFKKGRIFGYFIDDKLIGCVGVVVAKKHKYAELEHLLVHPRFQGRGIGRKLMDFAEKYAEKKKVKSLRLNVRVNNSKALKLYKKLKYKEHAYVMQKKLRQES